MAARHQWAVLAAAAALSAPALGVAAPTGKSADLPGDVRNRSASSAVSTPSAQSWSGLSIQSVTVVVGNGSGTPGLPPGGGYMPVGGTITILNPNLPTRNAGGTTTPSSTKVTLVEESAGRVQIAPSTSRSRKDEDVDRSRDK